VLLGLALLAALGAGAVSARRVGDQVAVLHACEAAARGDWSAALAGTEGRAGGDETGRAAAQCRCRALLGRGEADACAQLLDEVLGSPEADGWVPEPRLAVHVVQWRRDAGRALEAAELARRAASVHADDAELFYLELVTRAALEDERALLDELEARVPPRGAAAVRMRVSLANRHLLRGDPRAALSALGPAPPPEAGAALGLWYETRGLTLASAGDWPGLQRSFASWRDAGGDPAELEARLALTLSIAGLQPPGESNLERLQRALASEPRDPRLAEALTVRRVLGLVADARLDEALVAYDRGRERFALEGLARDELERAVEDRRLTGRTPQQRVGALRFRIPPPRNGATLWLSPQPDAPVDADYEVLPVPASGELVVERRAGIAPARWVLRGPKGATLASGTLRVRPGDRRDVSVVPRAPRTPQRAHPGRLAADGRRRVAVLLLDCGDWRILQYLRARGELPVLSALLEQGHRAVLLSDPPLTAAAMEALVWPGRGARPSLLGLAHRFGVELAGLASIGENPVGALAWLLPEAPDFFSVVGSGPHAAANLLFAHGGIQAGRHGIVTGPEGRRRQLALGASARDLSAGERERFPELAAVRAERDAVHLRTIAAELDAAEQLVREGEVDLFALRVEPLDILTHAHFAEAARDGQDDGAGLLFEVYRYLDARVGAVHEQLDEDDVLVVMSDHGIRTAMEHSRHAFFVASGAGVAPGRADGSPEIAGVPRALASLLGVRTAWPDTGVAAWAGRLARAPSLAPEEPKLHPARAVR
jgi:hypothetical protein